VISFTVFFGTIVSSTQYFYKYFHNIEITCYVLYIIEIVLIYNSDESNLILSTTLHVNNYGKLCEISLVR
jgi:hypothetical protein